MTDKNTNLMCDLLKFLILLIAVDSLALPVAAQSKERKQSGFKLAVDQTVEREMKRQNIVGISVGLISDAKIIYTQGYGFADVGQKVKFTDETVTNWASNSKPVVAVLAMQLAKDNKLDLDKPISDYLEKLPEHLHPLTVRQLLSHQSGIPHYTNGKIVPAAGFKKPKDEHDPLNAMKRFIESPLIFEPGAKESYSSYAYVLLTAVVQAASNKPIASLIAERITEPLSMKSFQMDVAFQNQSNWSKPYRVVSGAPIELPDQANFWKHGAGGYKSNVKDFAKFANSFVKKQLLNQRSLAQMMTPQATTDGTKTQRGLGVLIHGTGKSLKMSHNGTQPEARTRMIIYPKQRHGIVVMCNCRHVDPGAITTAIYSALKTVRSRK